MKDNPELTATDHRVLELLAKRSCSCTEVGETLFHEKKARQRQHYARPGGRAIQRLVRLGHVVVDHADGAAARRQGHYSPTRYKLKGTK